MATTQLQINWEAAIHLRENSRDNEEHLEEHLEHFAGQRRQVFSLLLKGVKLNSAIASQMYNIIHLPSAIRDVRRGLIQSGSKHRIVCGWMKDENGKRIKMKEWWIELETAEK